MSTDSHHSLVSRAKGISLGLFAADLGNLQSAGENAANWGCSIIHFDIMDGVFVPQFTGGAGFLKAVSKESVRDVHLMVDDPGRHIASFIDQGADIITVHAEAKGAAQAIAAIKSLAEKAGRPVLAGLGLMPGTSIQEASPLLDMSPDLVLVLSLDPRTKTPPDIGVACAKLSALRQRFGETGPILAFDGGVTLNSIEEIGQCNPDMIVSGSAVFGAQNPQEAFDVMNKVL